MYRISKHFDTIEQADEYQNTLYDTYDHVHAVQSPIFSESGTYVWEVKK